jgi:hypothetical protein
MTGVSTHPIQSIDISPQLDHFRFAEPSSNLNHIHPHLRNPRLPPPSHYSSSWQPKTVDEFHRWNQSPQGMFPLTPIGPGQNSKPLTRPLPGSRLDATSTDNPGKRKRSAPSGDASSVGGFGPAPSTEPGPPPQSSPTPVGRRNAASDVWAFVRPLTSTEPPPEDQWPTSSASHNTTKPKTPWFGCNLCSEFGCVPCPSVRGDVQLILFVQR